MSFTPDYISSILAAEAPKWAYVSLHTGDPGTTGANEATGGTPAYARKPVTLTVSGLNVQGAEVLCDAPAGTYTHFGLRSSAVGGTFFAGGPLLSTGANPVPTPQTLSSQGQVKFTPRILGVNP